MTTIKTVEEVHDFIETALDADAHGKWHRAPNFEIIKDVASLLAPRIITMLTTDRATTLTALCEGLEALPTINGMLHKEQTLAAIRTTLSGDASEKNV